MNYIEYGKENRDVICLLHGGGLSWWNYREVAEILSANYHVILPILDGHAKSTCDFTTIETNAARIIQFIDDNFGGSVMMIGGLSLGGQILLEMMAQRRDICQYALIESALVIPSKVIYAMVEPAFGSCHCLIKKKWFSKLQFKSLRIKQELFEEYYRDTCEISKFNMIAFLQENALFSLKESIKNNTAKSYVFVGEKESYIMRKSAQIICNYLKGSVLQVNPKMYHGEFSINHSNMYADVVKRILE